MDKISLSLDEIPIGIMIVNRKYEILLANKELHTLFGYINGELIGTSMNNLVPPEHLKSHMDNAEEYWKHSFPIPIGIGRNLAGLRKDKTIVQVEIAVYPKDNNLLVLVTGVNIWSKRIIEIKKDIKELENMIVPKKD